MKSPISLFIVLTILFWSAPNTSQAQGGIGHTIELIELKGNEKTRAEIIYKALPIKEGNILAEGDLERCKERLEHLHLFRTVFVNVKPGTKDSTAIVIVYVQEKRFGDLGLSLEYTELNGFGFSADAYHVNLRGQGKIMGAAYGYGERFKHWGFHYTDPWVWGTNQSLHFQVTGSSADRDLYRSSDAQIRGRYDLERIGATIGIGQPSPQRTYRIIFKYAIEAIQVGAFQKPTIPTNGGLFANEIEQAVGRETLSFLTLEFRKESGSIPWGSVPGFDLGVRLDISTETLGSVAHFLRLRSEIYRHFETTPGQILSIGGRAGLIWGTPPFHERFFLDGENQLRGVDRRDTGPEGGTQFFMAEALYSVQIKPIGRVYIFGESGGVRRPLTNTHQADTDYSMGIGLLLFNRVDISFGISTGTLILKSHRFGGIQIGL